MTLTWNLTMLVINVGLLAMLFALWKNVPEQLRRTQRVAMGLLVVATFILVFADAAAMIGAYWHWMFTRFAREIEHIAVIIIFARLFVADQEKRCLPSCSGPSPN